MLGKQANPVPSHRSSSNNRLSNIDGVGSLAPPFRAVQKTPLSVQSRVQLLRFDIHAVLAPLPLLPLLMLYRRGVGLLIGYGLRRNLFTLRWYL